jgi:hypothetical protein
LLNPCTKNVSEQWHVTVTEVKLMQWLKNIVLSSSVCSDQLFCSVLCTQKEVEEKISQHVTDISEMPIHADYDAVSPFSDVPTPTSKQDPNKGGGCQLDGKMKNHRFIQIPTTRVFKYLIKS